jgi:hypothetical protein
VTKSFHDFIGFKPGAEKFGKPSFVTPSTSQDYISQITKGWKKRYVWVSHCPLKEAAFDNKFCSPIEGSQSLLDWASLGR